MVFKNIKKILICLYLAYSLTGCVSHATDARKLGFDIIQNGFASIKESPSLNKVIELENVTIHIVGHRRYFDNEVAAAYGSPVAGYANTKNEIWLFGKIVDGKIVLNQAILGHELNHLLQFNDKNIAHPDKLDDLGA